MRESAHRRADDRRTHLPHPRRLSRTRHRAEGDAAATPGTGRKPTVLTGLVILFSVLITPMAWPVYGGLRAQAAGFSIPGVVGSALVTLLVLMPPAFVSGVLTWLFAGNDRRSRESVWFGAPAAFVIWLAGSIGCVAAEVRISIDEARFLEEARRVDVGESIWHDRPWPWDGYWVCYENGHVRCGD